MVQDVTQPVNGGALHRVLLEEVMLHEFHSTCRQSGGISLRPYGVFCLLEDGTAVLDDEAEFGVEL